MWKQTRITWIIWMDLLTKLWNAAKQLYIHQLWNLESSSLTADYPVLVLLCQTNKDVMYLLDGIHRNVHHVSCKIVTHQMIQPHCPGRFSKGIRQLGIKEECQERSNGDWFSVRQEGCILLQQLLVIEIKPEKIKVIWYWHAFYRYPV